MARAIRRAGRSDWHRPAPHPGRRRRRAGVARVSPRPTVAARRRGRAPLPITRRRRRRDRPRCPARWRGGSRRTVVRASGGRPRWRYRTPQCGDSRFDHRTISPQWRHRSARRKGCARRRPYPAFRQQRAIRHAPAERRDRGENRARRPTPSSRPRHRGGATPDRERQARLPCLPRRSNGNRHQAPGWGDPESRRAEPSGFLRADGQAAPTVPPVSAPPLRAGRVRCANGGGGCPDRDRRRRDRAHRAAPPPRPPCAPDPAGRLRSTYAQAWAAAEAGRWRGRARSAGHPRQARRAARVETAPRRSPLRSGGRSIANRADRGRPTGRNRASRPKDRLLGFPADRSAAALPSPLLPTNDRRRRAPAARLGRRAA